MPFAWYTQVKGELEPVMHNQDNFANLENLAELLAQMTDASREAYEKTQPLDPYCSFGDAIGADLDAKLHGFAHKLISDCTRTENHQLDLKL